MSWFKRHFVSVQTYSVLIFMFGSLCIFSKRTEYAPSISMLQAFRLYREVSLELHFPCSVSLECLGLNSFLCPIQCNVILTRYLIIFLPWELKSWEDLPLKVLVRINWDHPAEEHSASQYIVSAKEILASSVSLLIIFVNFRDFKQCRRNFRNDFFSLTLR